MERLPKFCPLTGVAVTTVATLQQFGKLYIYFVYFSVPVFYNKRSKTNKYNPRSFWLCVQNGFLWAKKLEDQSEG